MLPLRTTTSTGRSGAYYVPRGADAGPLPLLVLLHGRGGKGADEILHVTDLAEREKFIVVAPDSTSVAAGWLVGPGPGGTAEDLRHVVACVHEVLGLPGAQVDRARVLAAGFSSGARAAGVVATREDLFAAFAALHGPLVPDAFGTRRPPAWLSTGSTDRAWTPAKARASEDQLKRSGFTDITFRLFPGTHTLGKDELAALVAWWLRR